MIYDELRVGDERHKFKENLGNNIEELQTCRLKRHFMTITTSL